MTPLGDGHGPDAPKHPAKRFLTSPEGSARVVELTAAHSKALDELTDIAERVSAAIIIAHKAASILAEAGIMVPGLAAPAALLKGALNKAENALRGESDG